MKILQFGKFYYPVFGGMERTMYEIVEGFDTLGVTCDVLCSNTKAKNEVSHYKNYKVYRAASLGLLNSTPISPQLVTTLKKLCNSYDIIQVHHPDPMAFLALYLVRPSGKIIVQWQSDIVRQKKMLKLFRPLQDWVLKRADKIIVATDAYAEHSPFLAPYQEKIEVIPIGIAEEELKTDDAGIAEIENRYKGKKIVLSFGRLVDYKGFNYLIEAAQYLDDEYMILIGGNGPRKEDLEKLIEKHNLQDKVELLGHVDEKEKYNYFKASTLFCLPSVTKAEAYGVVLVEAMAFGKPIVSSNIKESGMVWVNQDQVTGLQVPSRSPEALAAAIEKIGNDPKLYREFSENAKKRYHEILTRGTMIENLKKLYQEII